MAENYLINFFNNIRRFLYSIWLFFFRDLQLENERDYNNSGRTSRSYEEAGSQEQEEILQEGET